MQIETERRLVDEALCRLDEASVPQADDAMTIDATRYIDADSVARERALLFRRWPLLAALSCELAEAGNYLAQMLAGVPVVLVRDGDGAVHAHLNVCLHRGARMLDGRGRVANAFACPYHGWSYRRDGTLAAVPGREHFPCVTVGEQHLTQLPAVERDGIIWVGLDPDETLDIDAFLGALGPELAAYGLGDHVHRQSHTLTQQMNWKLGVDTFLEAYHLPVLHRATIGKAVTGPTMLYEALASHARLLVPRRTIEAERGANPADRRITPHATIVYRIFPNTIFISQGLHVEVYRMEPDPERADTTVCHITFASPPTAENDARDWPAVCQQAMGVLEREDFALMEGVQAGLSARIRTDIVFGRNEIGLQNFHSTLDAALAG